jgi:hypothetical protein
MCGQRSNMVAARHDSDMSLAARSMGATLNEKTVFDTQNLELLHIHVHASLLVRKAHEYVNNIASLSSHPLGVL